MTSPGGPGAGAAVRDPRERFLRDIAERISAERIAEIHLFAPLRSGGRESGVAVIAAYAEMGEAAEAGSGSGSPPAGEPNTESPHAADQTDGGDIESVQASDDAAGGPPPDSQSTASTPDLEDQSDAPNIESVQRDRLVVYKAAYRWTRKGPDRGRWEVDITAEADAPLQAVTDVVRGVQRRAGEDSEPELITPAALRKALSDRPWAAAG